MAVRMPPGRLTTGKYSGRRYRTYPQPADSLLMHGTERRGLGHVATHRLAGAITRWMDTGGMDGAAIVPDHASVKIHT